MHDIYSYMVYTYIYTHNYIHIMYILHTYYIIDIDIPITIPPGPEVAVQLVEVQGLRTEKIRIVDLPRDEGNIYEHIL